MRAHMARQSVVKARPVDAPRAGPRHGRVPGLGRR